VLIEVGVAHAGKGGYDAADEHKVYSMVVDFITPETDGSMWYFWGMARKFNPGDASVTAAIKQGQHKIFSEDLEMLELQQRNLEDYPQRQLLKLNIDAGGVQSRKIIERLIDEEKNESALRRWLERRQAGQIMSVDGVILQLPESESALSIGSAALATLLHGIAHHTQPAFPGSLRPARSSDSTRPADCCAAVSRSAGPDVTPVQYAILRMLQESPGIDQVTLARLVALDNSTTADIAARLESKGWIHRELLPRRQRRLSLTTEGEAMLAAFVPNVYELQQRMLSALEPEEQAEFKRLLRKFVQLHDSTEAGEQAAING
jgi:DNA-binding MarR family transcriptional regulator